MFVTEILFWVLYIGGLVTALIHPIAGVLLYILVYHLNPEYQWWGNSIRESGLRTSLIAALATVIGLMIRRPRFQAPARQFPLSIVLMGLLCGCALASLAWGFAPTERGLYQTEKLLKVFIFVLLLVRVVREPEHYHLVFWSWLLGVLYIGYQAWGNVGARDAGRLAFGLGGPDFAESSDLSVHLVATLPMIGAAFFMARTWLGRGLALCVGALSVNTIILTRTRNALFGLAAMAMIAALALPRRYRIKGLAAIAVGIVLSIQLADPGWWNRMFTIANYQQDSAAVDRLTFWRAAVRMAADHPLGIGVGNFETRIRDYVPGLAIDRSAHNTFLECLAEMGVPGFTLLTLLIVIVLLRLASLQRGARQFESAIEIELGRLRPAFHLGWHAMAIQSAIVGYLACALFTTRLWAEDLWILLGLSACLCNVGAWMGRGNPLTLDARRDGGPEEPDTRVANPYAELAT